MRHRFFGGLSADSLEHPNDTHCHASSRVAVCVHLRCIDATRARAAAGLSFGVSSQRVVASTTVGRRNPPQFRPTCTYSDLSSTVKAPCQPSVPYRLWAAYGVVVSPLAPVVYDLRSLRSAAASRDCVMYAACAETGALTPDVDVWSQWRHHLEDGMCMQQWDVLLGCMSGLRVRRRSDPDHAIIGIMQRALEHAYVQHTQGR